MLKAVITFNHCERHYAKLMASEFGVSIKALPKDALEIDDKRIDFVKSCTLKNMKKKKIVSRNGEQNADGICNYVWYLCSKLIYKFMLIYLYNIILSRQ